MSKSKPNSKAPLSPQKTLKRFIIRARRIEAHSMIQSGEAERLMNLHGNLSIGSEGDGFIEFTTAEDEERLESLAARVRPLIVDRESINVGRVLTLLGGTS